MMLKFFSKRKESPKTSFEDFLNEADEALIRSYESRDIRPFASYADPRLTFWLTDSIIVNKNLFGMRAYRIRSWEVIRKTDANVVVIKRLTHQHVRLSKQISMAIGDDVTETWSVDVTKKRPCIVSIREGEHLC